MESVYQFHQIRLNFIRRYFAERIIIKLCSPPLPGFKLRILSGHFACLSSPSPRFSWLLPTFLVSSVPLWARERGPAPAASPCGGGCGAREAAAQHSGLIVSSRLPVGLLALRRKHCKAGCRACLASQSALLWLRSTRWRKRGPAPAATWGREAGEAKDRALILSGAGLALLIQYPKGSHSIPQGAACSAPCFAAHCSLLLRGLPKGRVAPQNNKVGRGSEAGWQACDAGLAKLGSWKQAKPAL